MRVLCLFCGTKSIDRAFERLSWETVSVDWEARYAPDHVADIMSWDYKQYPKGHFDFVWGSPACTHFSIARTTGGPRDLEGACALVARTLEIMRWLSLGTRKSSHGPSATPAVDVWVALGRHHVLRLWIRLQEKDANLAHTGGRLAATTAVLQGHSLCNFRSRWHALPERTARTYAYQASGPATLGQLLSRTTLQHAPGAV